MEAAGRVVTRIPDRPKDRDRDTTPVPNLAGRFLPKQNAAQNSVWDFSGERLKAASQKGMLPKIPTGLL